MDEAKLLKFEARANETVRRCTHCDAPARWWMVGARGASVWLCDEHNTRPSHAPRIEAVELDALDLVAEVRRLTAALGAVTTERDALRSAAEEREMDMHQRIRAGYDRTIADSWRAEVVRAVAAERDVLRAEHAVALATARREGAEEMREALIVRFTQRVEYLHPWAEAEDDENGCHSGAWTEALNAVQFTRDMVLPLDAPGGAT